MGFVDKDNATIIIKGKLDCKVISVKGKEFKMTNQGSIEGAHEIYIDTQEAIFIEEKSTNSY